MSELYDNSKKWEYLEPIIFTLLLHLRLSVGIMFTNFKIVLLKKIARQSLPVDEVPPISLAASLCHTQRKRNLNYMRARQIFIPLTPTLSGTIQKFALKARDASGHGPRRRLTLYGNN